MKRALLTGASGGLGSIIRARLHADESTLWMVNAPTRFELDFSRSPDRCDTWLRKAAEGRKFDAIIHCAGSIAFHPLFMASDDDYAAALGTLHGAFTLLRAALGICNPGASIILISSAAAHKATRGLGLYAAAKAGMEAMARTAALELARERIRVNCIAPGTFTGPMLDRLNLTPDMRARLVDSIPLGLGTPSAVVGAVEYLLGADWVTGTTVHVDGGMTL